MNLIFRNNIPDVSSVEQISENRFALQLYVHDGEISIGNIAFNPNLYYDKNEINDLIQQGIDVSGYATQEYVDGSLAARDTSIENIFNLHNDLSTYVGNIEISGDFLPLEEIDIYEYKSQVSPNDVEVIYNLRLSSAAQGQFYFRNASLPGFYCRGFYPQFTLVNTDTSDNTIDGEFRKIYWNADTYVDPLLAARDLSINELYSQVDDVSSRLSEFNPEQDASIPNLYVQVDEVSTRLSTHTHAQDASIPNLYVQVGEVSTRVNSNKITQDASITNLRNTKLNDTSDTFTGRLRIDGSLHIVHDGDFTYPGIRVIDFWQDWKTDISGDLIKTEGPNQVGAGVCRMELHSGRLFIYSPNDTLSVLLDRDAAKLTLTNGTNVLGISATDLKVAQAYQTVQDNSIASSFTRINDVSTRLSTHSHAQDASIPVLFAYNAIQDASIAALSGGPSGQDASIADLYSSKLNKNTSDQFTGDLSINGILRVDINDPGYFTTIEDWQIIVNYDDKNSTIQPGYIELNDPDNSKSTQINVGSLTLVDVDKTADYRADGLVLSEDTYNAYFYADGISFNDTGKSSSLSANSLSLISGTNSLSITAADQKVAQAYQTVQDNSIAFNLGQINDVSTRLSSHSHAQDPSIANLYAYNAIQDASIAAGGGGGVSQAYVDGSLAARDTSIENLEFILNTENRRKETIYLGVSSTDVITTGAKGRKTFGFYGEIIGWKVVSDVATNLTLDVWADQGVIPTNSDSLIGAGTKISMTADEFNEGDTSDWDNIEVAPGTIFILEVEANSAAKYISLQLDILKYNYS